jgi:hypothetical protein
LNVDFLKSLEWLCHSAGEDPLSPNIHSQGIATGQRRGVPVDWLNLEPVVSSTRSIITVNSGTSGFCNETDPHSRIQFSPEHGTQKRKVIYLCPATTASCRATNNKRADHRGPSGNPASALRAMVVQWRA